MIENKQRFISQVFTSKTPERVMQEVDETTLSYAEIKALATGDERIMEHCTLTVEVNKLKMIKSSFMNERYTLESMALRVYPAKMQKLKGEIAALESDIALAAANTPPDREQFSMTVDGHVFTEKKAAGSAILEACKAYAGKEPKALGSYRGFAMELFFDSFSKEYHVTLRAAEAHDVRLGTDIHGNITRMDNIMEGMKDKLSYYRQQLEQTGAQIEAAKAELQVPFPREQELAEKTARLAALTVELKLAETDREFLDDEAPEEDDAPGPKKKVRELEL
jgi:hypothetical protein